MNIGVAIFSNPKQNKVLNIRFFSKNQNMQLI